MKDWTATITLSYQIQATNEEQAEERAQELADRLTWVKPGALSRDVGNPPKWLGDMTDTSVEVEEA